MADNLVTIKNIAEETKDPSGFVFLQSLEKYIESINSDPFLSQVVDSIHELNEQESIKLLKESKRLGSDFDEFIIREELQPEVDEKYPVFEWKKLNDAVKKFQLIKQYGSEEDIPDITVTIPEEKTEHSTLYASKISLRRIPYSVEISGWRTYFNTFHTALVRLAEEAKSKGGVFSKYFDFDPKTGTLYFQGKEIKINERKKITNAHHLLSYLFTNDPFEQHFYQELEKDEVLLESKSWSSYHRTCEDIQNKVEKETGIGDFLDYNSGPKMYVRINPKYSSG